MLTAAERQITSLNSWDLTELTSTEVVIYPALCNKYALRVPRVAATDGTS
jgi:hypothetical protein